MHDMENEAGQQIDFGDSTVQPPQTSHTGICTAALLPRTSLGFRQSQNIARLSPYPGRLSPKPHSRPRRTTRDEPHADTTFATTTRCIHSVSFDW